MRSSELKGLLRKYVSEKITGEERERFLTLAAEPENEAVLKDILLSLLEKYNKEARSAYPDFEKMFCNILDRINLPDQEVTTIYRKICKPASGRRRKHHKKKCTCLVFHGMSTANAGRPLSWNYGFN